VRKSDLLAELTDVMSDGVAQDLWLLSIGIDNNPWGQYQPLLPIDNFFWIKNDYTLDRIHLYFLNFRNNLWQPLKFTELLYGHME